MGKKLGGQVKGAGFNVDFAPVADIVTNPNNTEIGDRSFSSDPAVASDIVAAMTRGLQEGGVLACLKHFPGHGSTEADSHLSARPSRTARWTSCARRSCCPSAPGSGGRGHDHGLAYVRPGRHGRQHALRPLPRRCADLLRTGWAMTASSSRTRTTWARSRRTTHPARRPCLPIEVGCDLILMPDDLDAALQALRDAAADGTLTEEPASTRERPAHPDAEGKGRTAGIILQKPGQRARQVDNGKWIVLRGRQLCIVGRGTPLPAQCCRSEQAIAKTAPAPELSLRGRFAPVAISEGTPFCTISPTAHTL